MGGRDASGGNATDAGDGPGVNASHRERWEAADEALLALPPLTSCSAAWFLIGQGPVPDLGLGVGDPCSI